MENKPKALKNALLYGLWTAFEGQAFMEFTDDSAHYKDGLFTHVIAPFDIPKEWPKYRSFDFGYSKPFAVQWWAVSPDDTLYMYREWYGSASGDNKGLKITAGEIAKGIMNIENESGEKPVGVADPLNLGHKQRRVHCRANAKSRCFLFSCRQRKTIRQNADAL